ncbi:MAG: carbon-nitrogen hydrolase family protein [Planctomycetota bacterium]|jgi:N-carbamoylputrescine amidase
MTPGSLSVALVHDVFDDEDGDRRLRARLREARDAGAELAILPELPLNRWCPASTEPRDDDAEPPEGPRWTRQAEAAAACGIGLAGGAIVRDPATGRRRNAALLFDANGSLVGRYDKLHLPEETGFWETSHYEPGVDPPARCDAFGLPLGVQVCSDTFRPEGFHLLGALGAALVVCPRATEAATWPRWRAVFEANAITTCLFIASVNRPGPDGVGIGGPSMVMTPDGRLAAETTDPVTVVAIDGAAVAEARRRYPGYLPVRPDVYAAGWSAAGAAPAG